ncbi:hypothetical protein PMSM_15845 [Paenibacillus macquariensis subsp. macquariensis]|uniref:SdpI/YhfL protein family protein n=2 Tax=Paenibacillus macquariensis TaxID=948756 RepID=A0ABY1JYE3_9BACL|nr:hypothetical protein [Paenibacillus macquariensis]OAB33494.1 hypothetical protein PMSM_15845 [Paenibacillus macquariensis subsp. macquariensis]SIQ98435.1 hypothetical protein SAMN05421578_105352 [Paenibacillus macquariensis]
MTLILLMGILVILVVKFNKKPITKIVRNDNKMVQRLRITKWYQNHWLGGVFLFVVNSVLFSSTLFGIYLAIYFSMSFLLLLVILFGVIGSIYSWLILNNAWQGSKGNRVKMGLVGSGFYALLALILVYLWLTLKPTYPGEDTFMGGIGILFGIIATMVAFSTCFVVTSYSKNEETT